MASRRSLAEEVDSILVVDNLDSSVVLGCSLVVVVDSLVAGKVSLLGAKLAAPVSNSSRISYTYLRAGAVGLVAADSKT